MKKRTILHTILYDVLHCFIISCGLTLIFIFFYGEQDKQYFYENGTLIKEAVKNMVHSIFTILCGMIIIYRILKHFFYAYEEKTEPIKFEGIAKADIVGAEEQNALLITRVHEAGHCVMSYLLGVENLKCIATSGTGKVTGQYNSHNFLTEGDFEKLILIDYAGAASEEIVLGNMYHWGCVGNETTDFSKAEQRIKDLLLLSDEIEGFTTGGELFHDKVREKSISLYHKTLNILSSNKNMIIAIVDALENKAQLTDKEIRDILDTERKQFEQQENLL